MEAVTLKNLRLNLRFNTAARTRVSCNDTSPTQRHSLFRK